jgi:hypothetical protein
MPSPAPGGLAIDQVPPQAATGDVIPVVKPRRPAVREPDLEGAGLRDGLVLDQADNDCADRKRAQIVNPLGQETVPGYMTSWVWKEAAN